MLSSFFLSLISAAGSAEQLIRVKGLAEETRPIAVLKTVGLAFANESAQLATPAEAYLRKLASRMSGFEVYLLIESLVEATDDGEWANALANERANRVRTALLADGLLPPNQVIARGYTDIRLDAVVAKESLAADGIAISILSRKYTKRDPSYFIEEIKARGLTVSKRFQLRKVDEALPEKPGESGEVSAAAVRKQVDPVAEQRLHLSLILPGTVKEKEGVPVRSVMGIYGGLILPLSYDSYLGLDIGNVAYGGKFNSADLKLVRYSGRVSYLNQFVSNRYIGFGALAWIGADYLEYTFKVTTAAVSESEAPTERSFTETEQVPAGGGGIYFYARPPEGRFGIRLSLEVRGNRDIVDVFLGIGVAAITVRGQ